MPSILDVRPDTLVDLLRSRAQGSIDRTAYTFLTDGERDEVSMTYAELDLRARALAAHLIDAGAAGSRVLLLYPSSLEYVCAFVACLYAGAVAVPAYPPRRNRSLDRIDGIVTNAEATHLLATRSILDDIERGFAEHPHLQSMLRIATDELGNEAAGDYTDPGVKGADLAFLQYTSGSTGSPKGVMVSHHNLMANQRLMQQAFQLEETDRLFGWLPLYHDMGLIGNVLHSLYMGMHCVLMAPVMFLQKPVRWLDAVSRYQATISGGPNFAFDLAAQKITPEQREGLDLSSWKLAVNGSEPIRKATLDAFSEVFAPYGFSPKSFFPCYGLAEATLFVSGGPRSERPKRVAVDPVALADNRIQEVDTGLELVSSGDVWDSQRIHILDPQTLEANVEGGVGEIAISGPSVAGGYWKKPDATEETFAGHVRGSNNGSVLRTGDLGFVRDGELFVTGRLKDLIIIRGRNHYPQDIEGTVTASHPALEGGRGAAFSIDVDDEEQLVIAHEVKRTAMRELDAKAVAASIRKAISEQHELHVYQIALLKPSGLPKTTSGKVQRRQCRADFLAGRLPNVAPVVNGQAAPAAPPAFERLTRAALNALPPEQRASRLAGHLRDLLAKARKMSPADIDLMAPLSSLGLDSLDMAELKVTIETDLELIAPSMEDLQDASVSELATLFAAQVGSPGQPSEIGSNGSAAPIITDLFAKCDEDGGYFGKYRLAKDKYFTQPVLEGPIAPRMRFEGKEVIVWSINNYLGLAQNQHIHDRARATLESHGTWSPMGSRLLTGNSQRHMALESRLAGFMSKEASIVFNFGYMGVIGTIHSLVGEADTVILDSLSHSCIVDGALLASRGKQFRVFRHNDMESLEDQLKAANANRRGGVLVVTEGLYGMTGDQAPLVDICRLKDQYGARLFIDDAHGFGVMGETGAGTAEHQGVQDQVDLYFGTFAKSFAAIGGVTAGDERVVEYIRYNARPNIFAKSLPMIYVDAVDAALDLVEDGQDRRAKVWHVARRLQKGLAELGYDLGSTDSPITPVYIPAGDEETAVNAMRLMRSEYGVFVSAVTYPVVPRGVVLFRLTASAAHTDEDVDQTLEAFRKLRDHLALPTSGGDGR